MWATQSHHLGMGFTTHGDFRDGLLGLLSLFGFFQDSKEDVSPYAMAISHQGYPFFHQWLPLRDQ